MKPLKVDDKYRTNPYSLIPGGCVLEVHTKDGKVLIYDKIKNPAAYVKRLSKDHTIVKAFVDGNQIEI
jgi:hypothetical protein